MSNEEFWINIWKIAGAVAITVSGFGASCTGYSNHIISGMVARGANPIDAACAVNTKYAHDICAIRAAKEANDD